MLPAGALVHTRPRVRADGLLVGRGWVRDADPGWQDSGPYKPHPHLHLPSPPQASPKLSTQQEAERQALQSLRQGGALTGKFMSTSSIPGCLLGVALESDSSPHGHASLLQHVLLLEQARQQSTLIAGEWVGGGWLCGGDGGAPGCQAAAEAPQGRPKGVARVALQLCPSCPPGHR